MTAPASPPDRAPVDPGAAHRARLGVLLPELASAGRRAEALGNLRLVLAGIGLALVLAPLFTRSGAAWWGLFPLLAAFLALGKALDTALERRRRLEAAARFHERRIARVDETWRGSGDGGADLAGPPGDAAAQAADLDLFGEASLFEQVGPLVTAEGRRTLARWLTAPAPVDVLRARQEAVRELASRLDVREALASASGPDPRRALEGTGLLGWARAAPAFPHPRLLRVVGWVQPALLFAAVAADQLAGRRSWLVLAILAQLVTLALTRRAAGAAVAALGGPEQVLARRAGLLAAVEGARLEAPLLVELQRRLGAGGKLASARIGRLLRLVELLDARLNLFFALSLSPALLWELNLALRVEDWRREAGPELEGWFAALGEFEALAALATIAHERPEASFPEWLEGETRCSAEGLLHPLLDRRRAVPADVRLDGPGAVVLLSGSNMSGKSTLLRALGVNVALAQAGGPVLARRMALTPVTLATSVRVSDSLAAGSSHFHAELRRLKAVIDRAAEGPVLYLLDEVLHGTNSRERLIGAVSVVRWLSRAGAIGIVTTHDLGLAVLGELLPPGALRNQHFSDQVVDGELRFDHVLREGPVATTNALRLMRAVGIDVELVELPPADGRPGAGSPA